MRDCISYLLEKLSRCIGKTQKKGPDCECIGKTQGPDCECIGAKPKTVLLKAEKGPDCECIGKTQGPDCESVDFTEQLLLHNDTTSHYSTCGCKSRMPLL